MGFSDLQSYLSCLVDPKGVLPVHHDDRDSFFLFSATTKEHLRWLQNRTVHKIPDSNEELSMNRIWNKFKEMEGINTVPRDQHLNSGYVDHSKRHQVWCRPPSRCIKLNTDAAMSSKGSVLGVVARNDIGELLRIHTFQYDIHVPEVAELEAVLKAMQLAISFGWTKVCVESDALTVINSLSNGDKSSLHWSANFLFKDILSLVSSLNLVSFDWAPRKANRVAHTTSKWAAKN